MNLFKKYFIPHQDNQYKPHLLRNEVAFSILALILVIEGAFLSQAVFFGRDSGFLALILPNTLIDQTNQSRIAASLPALTENPLLTAAAQEKANDMAAKGYFAHTSPAGVTPWYWFQKVGYKYTHAGENLAVNFSDSRDVENAWMNSPDHRANILNASYTQIGIATAEGAYQGQPTVFVVQLFGRPPVPKAAPAPAPVVATVTPKPAPTPAPVSTPAPVPAPQPVPAVPQPEPATEPVAQPAPVVPPAQVASNQQNSVAVEGASTQVLPASATKPPVTATAPTATDTKENVAPVAAATAEVKPQSNIIQRIFAAPRLTSNMIYMVLGALIFLALILNVFMKISVQHPQLVLNGLMILLVLGTLAVFNQHLLLADAQVF